MRLLAPVLISESTLMTGVTPDMRAYNEELFGPVLPIWPFATEEEALRLANASTYRPQRLCLHSRQSAL